MSAEHGMVDISSKPSVERIAMARGVIHLGNRSIASIRDRTNPKGDVLENARLAAIHAVKLTPNLVFMAHPIRITSVKVYFEVDDATVGCEVRVSTTDRTGVEIEAIAGVNNALLAIFDLCKRFEKDEDGQYNTAIITDIRVVDKRKGDISPSKVLEN